MKKLSFLLVGLLAFTITSCTDEDPNINVFGDEEMTVAPILEVPTATNYVVVETIADDEIVGNETETAGTFTWSAAQSEYNGEIQYYLQMAPAGSNFVDSARLFTTGVTDLSKSFTFGELNIAMNRLNKVLLANGPEGIEFGNATAIDVRAIAVSGASQATIYSEPVTINVTAYETFEIVTPTLYLVGAPQAYYGVGAWSPENALPMRYIGNGTTKVFEAYVKVGAGDGLKFIGNQAPWEGVVDNFGTIGGAQNGTLENSGGSSDVKVAETDGDGLYYILVDIDALTYKAVKMNWGIIGSATAGGWDSETAMTYDFTENKFSITATLAAGELKFRAANASQFIYGLTESWKFNVGNSDPMVTYNGGAGNFPIAGGAYNLTLSIGIMGEATVTGL